LLLISRGATAQDEMASWLWTVETDDGDALVEPGESAIVTLTLDLEPDAGEGDVLGFGAAIWDTIGSSGASNGQLVDWLILNHLGELLGDVTTTDGVSLFGTVAGDLPGIGPDTFWDPIDVLQFEWTTDEYSNYTVEYDTFSASYATGERGLIDIYLEHAPGDYEAVQWPVVEAAVSFQVVPAPGALVPGAILLTTFASRRRR
jgi:hypothetical protein